MTTLKMGKTCIWVKYVTLKLFKSINQYLFQEPKLISTNLEILQFWQKFEIKAQHQNLEKKFGKFGQDSCLIYCEILTIS